MTFDWWTLGLQTVNILILVWLLQRFFWTPIADIDRTAARNRKEDARRRRAGTRSRPVYRKAQAVSEHKTMQETSPASWMSNQQAYTRLTRCHYFFGAVITLISFSSAWILSSRDLISFPSFSIRAWRSLTFAGPLLLHKTCFQVLISLLFRYVPLDGCYLFRFLCISASFFFSLDFTVE